MKKTLVLAGFSLFCIQAQINLNKFKDQVKDQVDNVSNDGGSSSDQGLSTEQIAKGLKEALQKGAEKAVGSAGQLDGFNTNTLIRIPFPEDAQKVKDAALKLGLNDQVNQFETQLNRAAEQSSKEALNLLAGAITSMSIADAKNILEGEDNAATLYLEEKTSDSLHAKFRPIVKEAIEAVELTKYYEPLAAAYNKVNIFKKEEIDPDLEQYVLDRALDGLFKLIAAEEKEIRDNPAARITDLLKKVFG